MDWIQLEINTQMSPMKDMAANVTRRMERLKSLELNSLPFVQGLSNHTLERSIESM